jgi:predicted nucleic acid-binding protein
VIVVDASVWVSTLARHDTHYAVSRDWLDRYVASGGLVLAPVILLAEVGGAIARLRNNPRRGRLAVSRLRELPRLRLVPHDLGFAETAARVAADLRLRGADAMYVTVAYAFNIPLVTWDREQQQRAGAVVTVQTPT